MELTDYLSRLEKEMYEEIPKLEKELYEEMPKLEKLSEEACLDAEKHFKGASVDDYLSNVDLESLDVLPNGNLVMVIEDNTEELKKMFDELRNLDLGKYFPNNN